MIKSRILANQNTHLINWFFVFTAVAVMAFLRSVTLSQVYATPLEIVVWYPVTALSCFLTVAFILNTAFNSWVKNNQKLFYLAMLLSAVTGFLFSLIPVWGQMTAGMPLTLTQAVSYLLTLGVYPLAMGPDGFLRGLAWGLTVAIGILFYKNQNNIFKSLLAAFAVWLGMALIMILPSLVLMATFAFKSLPMAWSSTDLIGEFTRINLFSYWADGQILRWFTGFGSQSVNALLLYTGSVVFAFGVMFWLLGNLTWVKRLLSYSKFYDLVPLILIVLYGYQAGLGRQGWVGIDWAGWLVLVFVFGLSWLHVQALVKGVDLPDTALGVLGLLGALLLGWPVLLGYLAVIFSGYAFVELQKIIEKDVVLELFRVVTWPILALLIALFMKRGLAIEPKSLKILAVLAVFAILVGLIKHAKEQMWSKIIAVIIWLTAALLLWIVTGVFAPVAIMIFAGVFLWLFWQKITDYKWAMSIFIWGVALVVLLLVFWLPRLAKPELFF